MATFLRFSNDPSDVSGFLKLYVNERSPNASATASTAVTDTTAGVINTVVSMTLTAGGTAAKWLTAPIGVAVTIASAMANQAYGIESAGGANAQIAYAISQYTTSTQTAFATTSIGAELPTSNTQANITWVTSTAAGKETVTSTALAVGDRIAVIPGIGGYGGAMGTGETVTWYYNGTSGVNGDSWILLQEDVRCKDPQIGTGESAPAPGVGVSYFYEINKVLQDGIDRKLWTAEATCQALQDDAVGSGTGTGGKANV